jgi:hypothetical protein
LLTSDLVRVRRKDGELQVVPIAGRMQERALELAEVFLAIARAHVGRTREELEEALAQVECAPRERLLCAGLCKLIEDRLTFDVCADAAPEELRRALFQRAAAARRALDGGAAFDRTAVLAEIAQARGLQPEQVEQALYADLRGAHVLREIAPLSAAGLVAGYDLAQAQAVLLRAVRVRADVRCASPGAYRTLFRRLKFLRLLHTLTPQPGGGYRIEIDGPYSLFESVTKYGLQLALALPAIVACERWELVADVRWGKTREALIFRLSGGARGVEAIPPQDLPDEVAALYKAFAELQSDWAVDVAQEVLHLPGVGTCVPDLVFSRKDGGPRLFLEALGFWSRQAVWRRVELVEKGLSQPILFCVSSRLRVSEEALPEEVPAALYVYKGVMSAKAVAERLDRLAGRLGG